MLARGSGRDPSDLVPVLWKPKLRIPGIYEDPDHQRAFGQFLDTCLCCGGEDDLIAAIGRLDERWIKGLGPAVANLLCFLHPTLASPFNTAIVKGHDALTGARVKLGRWDEYDPLRAENASSCSLCGMERRSAPRSLP